VRRTHRYALEFEAAELDEGRLLRLLEAEFHIDGITVSRSRIEGAAIARPHKGVARQILDILGDARPWRQKAIAEKLGAPKSTIARVLGLLTKQGLVQRLQQGVYLIAGARPPRAAEMPAWPAQPESPTTAKALSMLSLPRTMPEIREELGVTRQRVEQLLAKLVAAGKVKRMDIQGGDARAIFLRADCDSSLFAERTTPISDTKRRVLGALTPEAIHSATDICSVAGIAPPAMFGALNDLSGMGLLLTYLVAGRRYASLTQQGLEHAAYEPSLPKAPAADVVAEFGSRRAPYLQALSVLGELKSLNMTDALPDGHLDSVRYGTGQTIRDMAMTGLIEVAERKGRGHAKYRLTRRGQFAAAVINRIQEPPSREELLARIERRSAKRIEKLRRVNSRRSGGRYGSPALDAIVDALREHGPMRRQHIIAAMKVKYANPRSMDLALRSLLARGVLGRRQVSGATFEWFAIEGGEITQLQDRRAG
jgi:DNA-binding MarR family transcriptional regulator